jgi:hypothetical protein
MKSIDAIFCCEKPATRATDGVATGSGEDLVCPEADDPLVADRLEEQADPNPSADDAAMICNKPIA